MEITTTPSQTDSLATTLEKASAFVEGFADDTSQSGAPELLQDLRRHAGSLFTLRFTTWECGHHAQKPDDIAGLTADQATLVLQAVANAISQPGQARAILFNDTHGVPDIYVTDDSVSDLAVGKAPRLAGRPHVVTCDYATHQALLSYGLKDARELLFDSVTGCDPYHLEAWDGNSQVYADEAVVTTLTQAEIEAQIEAHANAWPAQDLPLFQLPPLFVDGVVLLAELCKFNEELAAEEAESGT